MLPLITPSAPKHKFFEHFNFHLNTIQPASPFLSFKKRSLSSKRSSEPYSIKLNSLEMSRETLNTEPSRITNTSEVFSTQNLFLHDELSKGGERRESLNKIKKKERSQNENKQTDSYYGIFERVSTRNGYSFQDELSPWSENMPNLQSICSPEKQQSFTTTPSITLTSIKHHYQSQLPSKGKQSQFLQKEKLQNFVLLPKPSKLKEKFREENSKLTEEFYNFIGKNVKLMTEKENNSQFRRRNINYRVITARPQEQRVLFQPEIKKEEVDKRIMKIHKLRGQKQSPEREERSPYAPKD